MSIPMYVKIKEEDNVAIMVREVRAGTEVSDGMIARQDIPQAHKIALCDIPKDGKIMRYGVVLGYAVKQIRKGDWINETMLVLPTPPSLEH
ncbi:MAG: UxaA family hydrolase [Hungatella sp.]